MSGIANILPWIVSALIGITVVLMQAIGGGGRPCFPLLACYLPLVLAGLVSMACMIRAHPHRVPDKECLLSALLLGCYLVARSCHGGDPGQRVFEILRIAAILLVYLITVFAVTASGPRLLFLGIMLGSGFLQALAEMYQFHVDRSWSPLGDLAGFVVPGSSAGTYASKNHLSWLLCDAAVMAVSLGCSRSFRWPVRTGFLYLFFLLSYGVLISSSRGGMVSLFVALSIFAVIFVLKITASRDMKRGAVGLLGLGILTLTLASVWWKLGAHPRLFPAFHRLWMDTFREDLWRAAIHDLGQSPFLGNGVSSFQWSARIMIPWESILAHNDYLQLLSEYGIAGALLLLAALGFHLFRGFAAIIHEDGVDPSSRSQAILTGSFCVVMAQVVHSALDFNMHLAANALPAGFFMGVLASATRVHGDGRALRLPGLAALAAFSLVIIGFLVAIWNGEKVFFQAGKEYQATFLPGGPPLSDSARRLLPLLNHSPDNDRYADLGALILMTSMAGEPGSFPQDSVFWLLQQRLRTTARHVPRDWYLWVALCRASGLLGHEEQGRSDYIRAMLGLPLYAYPHQEEALLLENEGEIAQALHLHRIGLRMTDPRKTLNSVRRLEGALPKSIPPSNP